MTEGLLFVIMMLLFGISMQLAGIEEAIRGKRDVEDKG